MEEKMTKEKLHRPATDQSGSFRCNHQPGTACTHDRAACPW